MEYSDGIQLDLIHYLEILKRRARIAILTFALVIGVTAWRLIVTPPEYLATAKIVIEPDFSQIMLPENTAYIDSYYLETVSIETELQIIKSRGIAEGVVDALGLARRSEPEKFKSSVNSLLGAVDVKKIQDTRVFLINVTDSNPEMAQKIANTLVDVYIKSNIQKKLSSYRDSLTWLNEQLIDLKKRVETSETTLLNYIENEKIIVPSRTSTPYDESSPYTPEQSMLLQDLKTQLVNAELEHQKLLIKYKEKYPKVQKLAAEITSLKRKIEEEKQKIIENNKKAIRYSIMKRDVDLNKELYNSFMKKLKELDIASEVKKSNVSVIEYAQRPGYPVKPKKYISIVLGILIGIMLGIVAAFAQEHLDRTISKEEQVQEYLGIPLLGVIPHLETDGDNKIPLITSFSIRSTEAELYRIFRTNLKMSLLGKRSNIVLITSTAPTEGKTTTAVNLAITLSQAGIRTLLIDADLRRPSIHKIFNLPVEPGLTDLLIEDVKAFSDVITYSDIKNLHFVSAGHIPPNPSELLESGRLPEIIRYAHENYDQVIIDSPPIGMVSDTSILAGFVDGVVFVIYAEKTDRFIAARGIKLLKKNKVHIYGAVLNNMQKEEVYKSYYYYYYYSQYGYGTDTLQKEVSQKS